MAEDNLVSQVLSLRNSSNHENQAPAEALGLILLYQTIDLVWNAPCNRGYLTRQMVSTAV